MMVRWIVTIFFACGVASNVTLAQSTDAPSRWDEIYSSDLPTFVSNLRTQGFPEESVAVLVSHELNVRYHDRERSLQPSSLTVEGLRNFWSPETRAAIFALRLEKQLLMRAAMGVTQGITAETDWLRQSFPRLAPGELDRVRTIMEEYGRLIEQVTEASRGFPIAEDRDALAFLETERARDLAAVLQPAEVIDFQLKQTKGGEFVREDLACFGPTPEEARDYYSSAIRHGYDRIALELFSVDVDRRRARARNAIVAELASVWPEERVTHLRRAVKPQFRSVYRLVVRLDLPTATADRLFDAQTAYWASLSALRSGKATTGDTPERRAIVVELYQRYCNEVRALLGEAGLAQYLQGSSREIFERNAVGEVRYVQPDI